MSKLSTIKQLFKSKTARSILTLKKNSPEIMMVAGVIGVVVSTVKACQATLKVYDVIEEHEETMKTIEETVEKVGEEKYPAQDVARDKAITYGKTAFGMIKIYTPSALILVGSLACFIGSHKILKKRNLGLIAAYKTLDEGFKKYRARVVDKYGSEEDWMLKTGVKRETEKIENEDGTVTEVVKETFNPNEVSMYAKFFDESSKYWEKDSNHNYNFVKCQQSFANDLLRAQGHLFLNEVYDMLGIKRTKEGAVVGWVMDDACENFVDFGLYEDKEAVRLFVNGYERSILLDFNVDGVIYDMI